MKQYYIDSFIEFPVNEESILSTFKTRTETFLHTVDL